MRKSFSFLLKRVPLPYTRGDPTSVKLFHLRKYVKVFSGTTVSSSSPADVKYFGINFLPSAALKLIT